MPEKKDKTEIYTRWVDFILSYWPLLNKDQRDSYILQLADGYSPPEITLEEMTDIEINALRQHQGSIIQEARKRAGMTLDDLAALIGKQKAYLSLVESGQRTLTVVDMYRVMGALSISANDMFDFKATMADPFNS